MDNVEAFTLRYGGKSSWFDCNRQFLPMDHPFRKIEKRFTKNKINKKRPPYMFIDHDVWEVVRDFPKVTDNDWATKFPGYGKQHN